MVTDGNDAVRRGFFTFLKELIEREVEGTLRHDATEAPWNGNGFRRGIMSDDVETVNSPLD